MKQRINYNMLSLLQFLLAVLVVIFHCSRIFPSDAWNFIQKNLVSRLAVPFFMIASAFLIRLKATGNPMYKKRYFKKYLKNYLVWSFLYIPYGYFYFLSLEMPKSLLPIGIIFALLYIGMCYQLWYLIAFLTGSLLVDQLAKRWSLFAVAGLASLLYVVGSIETYAGYLSGTSVIPLFEQYMSLFFTTRNGLFFAPIFICGGYLLYEYRTHPFFTKKIKEKLFFSLIFLCLEGYFIYQNPGVDKNFLFALIPASLFLFNWGMRTSLFERQDFQRLKALSMLYFFIHPAFIEIFFLTGLEGKLSMYSYGWASVVFTLIGTHLMAEMILWVQSSRRFSQWTSALKEWLVCFWIKEKSL